MTSLTRRDFVQGAGLSAVIGAVSGKRVLSARSTTGTGSTRPGIYEELGIRPLINAAGTYTALSASLMPRDVSAAMEEAELAATFRSRNCRRPRASALRPWSGPKPRSSQPGARPP